MKLILLQETMINGVPSSTLMMVLFLLTFLLGLIVLGLTVTIWYLIKQDQPSTETASEPIPIDEEKVAFSAKWWEKKLGYTVPIEAEEEIVFHHVYDGIQELDNNLPPWWKWGFYITIGFAVVYLFLYEFSSDWSSKGEYEVEMAEAEVIKQTYLEKVANMVNETNVMKLTDASALSGGENIYNTYCHSCHGMQGEGGIGPAFADTFWIHGGDIKDVFRTIKYGVPEKGMVAWQEMLKPKECKR